MISRTTQSWPDGVAIELDNPTVEDNVKTWEIRYGGEYMRMREDGCISRAVTGWECSGQWKVVGAVRLNNFGAEVERYSLEDVKSGRIQWKHKNGNQRVHILDFDHGTYRMWGCPGHSVHPNAQNREAA
jgi:hypothetical protein